MLSLKNVKEVTGFSGNCVNRESLYTKKAEFYPSGLFSLTEISGELLSLAHHGIVSSLKNAKEMTGFSRQGTKKRPLWSAFLNCIF